MKALWKAIIGKGNRITSLAGFGALLVAVGRYWQTGEIDNESLGIAFAGIAGMLARGGGTGSDAPKKALLMLLALPLIAGCASSGGQGTDLRPVLKRTQLDAEGNTVAVVEVSLEGDLISQGCIAYDIDKEGSTSFVLSQYGSSDWSSVRGLVSIIPETVAVMMNPISTPIDALVQALSGRPAMEPPAGMENPCAVLYQSE